jgi:hypothetical protein
MKYLFAIFISVVLYSQPLLAQDETPEDKPVRDFFAAGQLVDQQTVVNPVAGGLEFIIQHRFGVIKELSDLYGIYAPSNIRMGFAYGLTNNLMIGFGSEKNSKMQDIQLKYSLLKQSRSGRIPVSVSYFFDFGIDARSDETFGKDYSFTNRLSYFNQVIIARKFSDAFSLQLAPSYTHVNKVDSVDQNGTIGLSASCRLKVYNEISLLTEYHHPFYGEYQQLHQKNRIPNAALGVEFATSTHAFQIFATTDDRIAYQKSFQSNNFDLTQGDFLLGFNITVRF